MCARTYGTVIGETRFLRDVRLRKHYVVGPDVIRRQLVHQIDLVVEAGLPLEPRRHELLEDFRLVRYRGPELGRRRRGALVLGAVLPEPCNNGWPFVVDGRAITGGPVSGSPGNVVVPRKLVRTGAY